MVKAIKLIETIVKETFKVESVIRKHESTSIHGTNGIIGPGSRSSTYKTGMTTQSYIIVVALNPKIKTTELEIKAPIYLNPGDIIIAEIYLFKSEEVRAGIRDAYNSGFKTEYYKRSEFNKKEIATKITKLNDKNEIVSIDEVI